MIEVTHLDINGVDLHCEVHGSEGLPVLFMHGFLSSRAHWMPNIPEFIDSGFRPVVLELYGHGLSPIPESIAEYHPQNYIQQFELIREALGVPEWFICGQSLGAGLTLNYAYTHPDKIIAQVFTNSRAAMTEAHEWTEMLKNFSQEIREKGQLAITESNMNPVRSRRLRADIKAALVEHNKDMCLKNFEDTMHHTVPHASIKHKLKDNPVSTLHVFGQRERSFQKDRDFIFENMDKCEVVDLERSGHAVNLDDAEAFNRAVINFFTKNIKEGNKL